MSHTSVDRVEDAMSAVPSCALDERVRREQSARFARLAASVARVDRNREAIVIEFESQIDRATLERALAWGVIADGFRPDRFDLLGAATCLIGAGIIIWAPR